MKQERNSAIMDEHLLEEANALFEQLKLAFSRHTLFTEGEEYIWRYQKLLYKANKVGCTVFDDLPELKDKVGTTFHDKMQSNCQTAHDNLVLALDIQPYLKEKESLILPLPEEQKAYLKKEAEKLSEFLKNLENFPEEKCKKLLDILAQFLKELEKEEQNISLVRALAAKIQVGLRAMKVRQIALGITLASGALTAFDGSLKAWDDIAPRLAFFEQAVLSYFTPLGIITEDEPKKLEEIEKDLKLTFSAEEN